MKKYTLKLQMTFLFFLISFPAMLLAIFASQINMDEAQQQILNTKKNSMQILANSYDTSLASAIEYMTELLYGDSSYAALQFSQNDTRYQQEKVWLKYELDEMLNYYPLISGFYVHITHTDEGFMSRRPLEISFETETALFERIKSEGCLETTLFQEEQDQYLVQGYRNAYMEMGFVLSLQKMRQQTENTMEAEELLNLIVDVRDDAVINGTAEKEAGEIQNLEVLEVSFEQINAGLRLDIPQSNLTGKISVRNRIIWYASISLLVLLPLFMHLFRKIFLIPMKKITYATTKIISGDSNYRIQQFSSSKEFYQIEFAFNQALDYNEKLKLEKYELKLEKEKETLRNLQLQINPHLLLNSLNIVYSLAVNGKVAEIQEFSINLAKYFRYSLRDTSELVNLNSEIAFIKSYINVQKVRYPNTFYVLFDIEDELMEEKIPPLLIQNFVENSTKYALKQDDIIEVLVIVKKADHYLTISVCDNGSGMDQDVLEQIKEGKVIYDSRGRHIGIWNCKKRLERFYGSLAVFHITSEKGKGTQVWIRIPDHSIPESNEEKANESVDN